MTTMSAASSSVGVREASHLLHLVVLSGLDAFRAQKLVQSVAWVALVVHPVLDAGEHTPVKLQVVVADRRVVENSAYVVHDFMFWNLWVIPRIDDTGRDVLQNYRSEFASRLVEYVTEVIFTEH